MDTVWDALLYLRYLEGLFENQKIGGAVLVAGFSDKNVTLDENEDICDLGSFFKTEVDFEKAKKHSGPFIAIHSDNDSYVALRYADLFKEKLEAKIVIEHSKGHFAEQDGITELPSAFESVLEIAK